MAVVALRWFKAALVVQILLLGYWLAMELVNLFPWNDLAARAADYRLDRSVAVTMLPLLALTGLFAIGLRPLAMLSVVGYALFLVMQVWTWWKPFILGADQEWEVRYAALFGRTLKLMPPTDTYLPPDAQHLVLQLLTLATVIVTGMAVARMQHL